MRNYKAVWTKSRLSQEYEHQSLTYMINLFKNHEDFVGNWIPKDAKLDGL